MSLRHFLDYYRGRISYTEAVTMPYKIYHTFTYIMYKENLERERKELERMEQEKRAAAAKADAERQAQILEEQERNVPKSGRELLMARIAENAANNRPASKQQPVNNTRSQAPFPLPQNEGSAQDIMELLEEEF